jgi:ADP-heptose:LPS heptosyltransferase
LLGLTTLHQLISILNKSDVIVSVDNFIMHAAHLIGKPAIIIWGPTNSAVYGYFEQIHLQCSTKQCEMYNECLGPDFPDNYKTLCPFKIRHCMNGISVNKIIDNACNICFS